jgi:hypothetical protein
MDCSEIGSSQDDMGFKYSIDKTDTHLLVTATGIQESLSECLAYIKTIIETCALEGYDCILLDERTVSYHETMLDTYVMAEFAAEKMEAYAGIKCASVPNPRFYSQARDFETLMKNKSLNFKCFRDIAQAEAWLRG